MSLKCEQNTPAMMHKVLVAACKYFHTRKRLQADFEHGQWFITDMMTGAQYSVVDAEGGDSVNGFSFEQVTEGDE